MEKQFTIEDLKRLSEGGGATLENFMPMFAECGYSVGLYGIQTTDPETAYNAIIEMNGNAGIWIDNGIYYVDCSVWVEDLREALALGRANNQISIYSWADDTCINC